MDKDEAITIIKQACASVQGNLEAHSKIQEAIRTIESIINPEKPKKPAKA